MCYPPQSQKQLELDTFGWMIGAAALLFIAAYFICIVGIAQLASSSALLTVLTNTPVSTSKLLLTTCMAS